MSDKPNRNILLITADQWRGDCLSARGHPCVKTPNLDALARQGILFENHYAVCAPCGPARASLLGGMYLQNHRSVRNGTPLDERFTNIAMQARGAGYDPVLFGYTDTSRDPRHTPHSKLVRETYEGVLPGFRAQTLLNDDIATWADYLKSKGYDVPENARDIYRPVAGEPDTQKRGPGFFPPPYKAEHSMTAFLARKLISYIEGQTENWFVHASFLRPHPPFIAPEPYNSLYSAEDVPAPKKAQRLSEEADIHPWMRCALSPDGDWFDPWMQSALDNDDYDREISRVRAIYYGLVTKIDHYIGEVIKCLKESGAYDNTLIIVTSDHGEMLGDHWLFGKRGHYDQSFHIPLIIRDPRSVADDTRGKTVPAFTECVDIMPTILEWLNLNIPRQCDGVSLMPFIEGQTPATWRREVHWEYDFRDVTDLRVENTLGISMDQCTLNVIRDDDYKYVHFTALPPLFFDRKNDPLELHNLANEPSYAGLMLKYARKLLSWRMENDERTMTGMKLTNRGVMERH